MRDCKHGQLARLCEICERERALVAMTAEIASLREAVVRRDEVIDGFLAAYFRPVYGDALIDAVDPWILKMQRLKKAPNDRA